jgi:hypothetical protein
LPTPDKWQHEVDDALFGTNEGGASPDRLEPAPLDFPPAPEAGSWRRDDDVGEDLFGEDDLGAVVASVGEQVAWPPASSSRTQPPSAVDVDAVDTALFGSAATSASSAPAVPVPAAPPPIERPVLDDADAAPFADPDEATVVDPDEDTIIAALAPAAGPTGPKRGRERRRFWVLAAVTVLVVIIGATAGAVIAGRSGSIRPERKAVSDHTTAPTATTAPVVTTTPVPATAPAVTAPPTASTAPRTPATSRRTVRPPAEQSVDPELPPPAPPPPAPLPPEPPPPEPPPSTSPPSTTSPP